MSASLNLPSLSRLWVYAERLNNYRAVRAVVRGGAGSMPVGALTAALQDLSDAVGSDRMIDLGVAVVSVGAFVGLMHWIGRGRGGIAAGLKLSVVSWLFLQALVSSGLAFWTAVGMDGEPDWGLVAFAAAVAVVLFVPTVPALKRLDP